VKNYKLLFIFLSLLLSACSIYAGIDTSWVRRYDSGGNDTDYARVVVVDNSGNVYVTGCRDVNNGHIYDYTTQKYTANGVAQWGSDGVRYNGTGNADDYATAMTVDGSGNVYVTGYSAGSTTGYDYATVKYNSAGTQQWVARYNNSPTNGDDIANAIAVDGSGNVYVTGASPGSSSDYDYVTVKYNAADGQEQWVQRYNGPGNGIDRANAMALRGDTVYVTGESYGSGTSYDYATIKYKPNGDTAWVRRYTYTGAGEDKAYGIAVDGSGNVYVTGSSNGSGTGLDYATVKYNALGVSQWSLSTGRYNYSGSNVDVATAIVIDGANYIYVTGYSGPNTNYDYATIKYNNAGSPMWVSRYPGPVNGEDRATAIALDNSNNVYVTGYSAGSGTGFDYTTIKYNTLNGRELWNHRYNGSGNGNDMASSIAVRGDTAYVTGGSYGTSMDYATIKYRPVRDVSMYQIIQPTGTRDSTATIIPSASVKNNGSEIETFDVTFRIGSWTSTKTVTNLPPDSIHPINFDPWTVGPRGGYTTKCSTRLAIDQARVNDTLSGSFTIEVHDYSATTITSPTSPVDSGTTITPKVKVNNYGSVDEISVPVIFYIVGTSYTSTKLVSLTSGDSIEQPFDDFIVNIPRGTYTMRCTTRLDGDLVPDNNRATRSFSMRVKDYAATIITSPVSSADSGISITPRAMIYNYGTTDEINIPVTFYIVGISGTVYTNTQSVSLNAGQPVEKSFNPFTLNIPRGSYTMRCTTQFDGDMVEANNLATGPFKILVSDVSITEIIQPSGITDSAGTITPKARVKNCGTQDATFNTTFTIGTWSSTKEVTALPPNNVYVISFDPWTVGVRGTYSVRCSTFLASDANRINDTLSGSFIVRIRDYAATAITVPTIIDSGTTITPKAWIHNYGSTNEADIPVTLYIYGTALTSTKYLTLNSGNSFEQTFDDFIINLPRGNYQLRCTTQLNGDIVVSNNLYTVPIRVVVPGWETLSNIALVSGRGVKDGGALTVVGDTLFALQGGNSINFYAYNITEDTWVVRCTIPYGLKPDSTINKRKVKAGGALTTHNDTIYAFKGNNTNEFWSYLPGQDSWIVRCNIPELASGAIKATKVKAGGALVTANDSIFAFKGGNTNEFWVYDIQNDTWYQRKSLVVYDDYGRIKKIKGGASLTAKGCTLYAFIGGSTNFFYSYIIGQDTWIKLTDVSFGSALTIRRKIKDGAALAEMYGKIFALKGGNTSDFGCYDISGDTWNTKEGILGTIKVKAGATMVSYNRQIYTLKGSNTNQVLRYTPSTSLPVVFTKSSTEKSIMTENISPILYATVDVKPNPFINSTTISYNIAKPGKVSLKLFAIDGSIIKVLCDEYCQAGSYTIRLAGDGLAKGIYFLKYNDELTNTEIKMIVR